MKRIRIFLGGVILVLAASALVLAQQPQQPQPQPQQPTTTTITQTPTTVTKTVQHPDGTFTVIEYPVKKEVKVMLTPVAPITSKGTATILRDDTGTRVVINLTDVPAEVTAVNLFAVDDTGAVTSLGPIAITNGTGTLTATTPLSKFMLIGSPETLTTYDPNTKVFFRSAVPEGFAVIPHTTAPVGEKVAASTVPAAATYTVPMLNIPAYKKGDDTKMKVNFSGALTGARANIFITPSKDGPTEVKLRLHDLKEAPAGKIFTVWAVSADNQFTKLGQIVTTGGKNEAEIKSDVALPDFGLLLTMEEATATLVSPAGPSIGIVEIIK
ncbi:MAG: hypothetical protein ACREBC_30690 [Pyrinomonadaceae bacterium]